MSPTGTEKKQSSRYRNTVNITLPQQASVVIHIATALTLLGYSIYHALAGIPLISLLAASSTVAAVCSLKATIRQQSALTCLLAFSIFTSLAILVTSWYFGYRGLIMLFPYGAALIFIFAFRIAIWWGVLLSASGLLLALNSMTPDEVVRFAIALMLAQLLTGIYASKMLDQQKTLWREANQDWLTGLMSRKRFTERFEQFLEEYRDHPGLFGMIYIDINDFKIINDQYGHAAGDAILVELARRLRQACIDLGYDNADYLEEPPAARLSGDEFALVTCHLDTEDAIYQTARTLREQLTGLYQWKNQRIELGVSIGVFSGRYGLESIESALAKADAAMYFAKKDSGELGLRLYDAEVEESYNQLFNLNPNQAVS